MISKSSMNVVDLNDYLPSPSQLHRRFQLCNTREHPGVHPPSSQRRGGHLQDFTRVFQTSITPQAVPTTLSCILRYSHSSLRCRHSRRQSVSDELSNWYTYIRMTKSKSSFPLAMKSRIDLWSAHFLPRPPAESLSITTGKEDEVTSSEEASTVDVRIEPKGMNRLQLALNHILVTKL